MKRETVSKPGNAGLRVALQIPQKACWRCLQSRAVFGSRRENGMETGEQVPVRNDQNEISVASTLYPHQLILFHSTNTLYFEVLLSLLLFFFCQWRFRHLAREGLCHTVHVLNELARSSGRCGIPTWAPRAGIADWLFQPQTTRHHPTQQ